MQRLPDSQLTPLMFGMTSPRPATGALNRSSEWVAHPSSVERTKPRVAPATHTPSAGQSTALSLVASAGAIGFGASCEFQSSRAGSVVYATWPLPSFSPDPTAVQKRTLEQEMPLNATSAAALVPRHVQWARLSARSSSPR